MYHPQNLHGKIRSGSTAGEDYRIHIFDCKSYPDRNIRDWTDDPAGFLPVQGTKKMQLGDVEKEKMPEKRIGLWLTIGLVIVVFGIVNFGMRKNAEGLRILLFIFLGIYLAEKFGFGLFLKVRKHKKSYYAKLIPYNSFYYRFKSTFRYVYVISLIPVLILFLFGKDMISAKIAQKPEGLFPYDFVCMATEADETFWKQLQENMT